MSDHSNKPDFKEIAGQLGCPSGDKGIKTAEAMAVNNGNMIGLTIAGLSPKSNDVILEIGPGNGSHVISLLANTKHLLYYGVDISALMISEAIKLNTTAVACGRADFSLSDGMQLNFADGFFTKIFTVNTLYFWKDPKAYATEIRRVLKPGGIFILTFAPREFMEKLPFTQYGFHLYSREEAEELLIGSGFEILEVHLHKEMVRSNSAGMEVEREIILINAVK
ncbi:Methyltransferase type 11 [Pedobacter cryoconitis]|uniref:Methyltransferase type 11 n=1 Tax=Pedobacter cryoconitis TaxID=188932 RepID=A0A127VB73_9SPHI|nr:class I SAM-dependent methyltransferase [Pedobacter cryoconitis]AMP98593.1 Methyltransferase type 11 [Pedobacter cryoconitis]